MLIPRLFFFFNLVFAIVLVSYYVNVSFAFGCMFYMTINLEISFGKVVLKYFELSCFVMCITDQCSLILNFDSGEPLIFIEVALLKDVAQSIQVGFFLFFIFLF